MATVDGKTSIKIDQLINDTVIDGEVMSGHLILRTRGGAEIDAGLIAATSALDFMPVGFVFTSVVSTSPQVMFGGAWVRIGQGRVLVGQDPTQTEFDVVEETGGEKSHALTTGELASHSHTINHNHAAFNTGTGGNHTHTVTRKAGAGVSTGVARGNATAEADGTTVAGGGHDHTANVPPYTGDSGAAGSGTPHNNLQPYLVVYMWKRTA